MNFKTNIAALGMLSTLSFGAFAAQSVNSDQAKGLQSVGVVTVSGVTGSPMDIRKALNDKAREKGANAYRVIENYQNGNWHASAELYK